MEEVNEAIRVLEEADYQANAEEERDCAINTRATVNQERFQTEHEADRYAEYVAMGWREPEPQDIGKLFSTAVTAGLKLTSSEPELHYARRICHVMLEKWPRWSRPTSTSIKR